jgi:probable rRNA maturation factor
MNVTVAVEDEGWHSIPALEELVDHAVAVAATMAGVDDPSKETAILLTSDTAIAELNSTWRGKEGPTNVLSFPAEDFPTPPGHSKPLGDIALAYGTVAGEAAAMGKSLPDHVTHLIVHGFLHLVGFDHGNDADAQEMEELERLVLKDLGIGDPYE